MQRPTRGYNHRRSHARARHHCLAQRPPRAVSRRVVFVARPGVMGRADLDPPASMNRRPFSQRIRADLVFHERLPGEEGFDTVQWSMPDTVFRLFAQEARRQKTDLNSLIRDVVCAALTERAEAIARLAAELDDRGGNRPGPHRSGET